jgi:hypothetical protein
MELYLHFPYVFMARSSIKYRDFSSFVLSLLILEIYWGLLPYLLFPPMPGPIVLPLNERHSISLPRRGCGTTHGVASPCCTLMQHPTSPRVSGPRRKGGRWGGNNVDMSPIFLWPWSLEAPSGASSAGTRKTKEQNWARKGRKLTNVIWGIFVRA